MTDFRELCAELHAAFNTYAVDEVHHALLARARAELAQPKPPADGEVAELLSWLRYNADYALHKDATATFKRFHRAADLLERLAQPEPQEPTNEELIQLAIDTRLYRFQATAGDPVQYEMTEQQVHAFARAVLARWGNR